jgi:hypothetical protein
MTDNAKNALKLDRETVSQKFALRPWGPFNTVDKVDVGIICQY